MDAFNWWKHPDGPAWFCRAGFCVTSSKYLASIFWQSLNYRWNRAMGAFDRWKVSSAVRYLSRYYWNQVRRIDWFWILRCDPAGTRTFRSKWVHISYLHTKILCRWQTGELVLFRLVMACFENWNKEYRVLLGKKTIQYTLLKKPNPSLHRRFDRSILPMKSKRREEKPLFNHSILCKVRRKRRPERL